MLANCTVIHMTVVRLRDLQATFTHAFQNPILDARLYEPLRSGREHFGEDDRLGSWVRANIQLPMSLSVKLKPSAKK
ncbi:hypothetical protein CV770_37925 [Bradyrhizobium sp. AC87j1]|nr:hypothetical protein CV770_37925 [Bradyrhizobium sp. AC87j1]